MSETAAIVVSVVGTVALVNGVAMLFNKQETKEVFAQVAENRTTSYVIGMFLLLFGATVTNILMQDLGLWQVWVAAVFGTITFLEGILFMVSRAGSVRRYLHTMSNNTTYHIIAIAYLAIGILLLFSD
jgi:hypothetical protein